MKRRFLISILLAIALMIGGGWGGVYAGMNDRESKIDLTRDNKIDLPQISVPSGNPVNNHGWLYVKDNSGTTNLYFEGDGGTVTNLLDANSTAVDFALTANADAGDYDIQSLDKLEFYDAGIYIDGGADGVLDITSDGTIAINSNDWDISATGTITNASMSADQISAGNLTIGNYYLSIGTDPADAGSIRLPNAGSIQFEADAAGTDVSALSVDSSEIVQIGASGASGVTITPAVTCSSDLTVSGTASLGTVQLNAVAPATGNLTLNAAGTGTVSIGNSSTGVINLTGGGVNIGDGAADTLTITGIVDGDVTFDDGTTDSPSLILKDSDDETGQIRQDQSSDDIEVTCNDAADSLAVTTGNLSSGTPNADTITLNGNDLFVTDDAEVDGTLAVDGDLDVDGTTNIAGATVWALITDVAVDITRNVDAAGTAPVLTVKDDHANSTQVALKVENDGTGNSTGLQISHDGDLPCIDIDAGAARTGDVIDVLMTNMLAERALNITGAWTGANGEGGIEFHTTGNIANGATMLRLDSDTGTPGGQGFAVNIDDDSVDGGDLYAVVINSANNEGLHVETGTSKFAEAVTLTAMPILNGGLDVNEDVDIDFDANDEEAVISTAAEIAAASNGTGLVTIESTLADVTTSNYLLKLQYVDTADANADFMVCTDASGGADNELFKVAYNGNITTLGGITGDGQADMVGITRAHESYTDANNVITIAESGKVFDNTGDADGSQHTLPEASTAIGCYYTFVVTAAQNMVVELDDADKFLHLGMDAGDQIQSSTVGDSITVVAIDAASWAVVSCYPASTDWADGGA